MDVFDALRNPPRSHSPAAIWWWSGEPLRRDRLRWQMERLVAGGVHNLVILNLAPSGPLFGADADDPPFLSEAWWELLDGVCEDALQLGARLWFYDQLGFSGADLQARLVQENPAFAGQWLAADGSVSARGFDYLSRTACEVLIDRVHGEFARRLGHRFGSVIAGSFQDELPTVPTWSATFAEEFLARRGYPFSVDAGPSAWRDHQRTRAELAEEAFFRPLAAWHAEHGLLNGCDQQDPARAGHPVEGVELYADYTRTHRWFSAPGSDHHGDARVHSSSPTCTAGPVRGSRRSTPAAGAARWRRRSTGCCPGCGRGPTSTTRTRSTTRRGPAGGSGRRRRPTGASRTGGTTGSSPTRSPACARSSPRAATSATSRSCSPRRPPRQAPHPPARLATPARSATPARRTPRRAPHSPGRPATPARGTRRGPEPASGTRLCARSGSTGNSWATWPGSRPCRERSTGSASTRT